MGRVDQDGGQGQKVQNRSRRGRRGGRGLARVCFDFKPEAELKLSLILEPVFSYTYLRVRIHCNSFKV